MQLLKGCIYFLSLITPLVASAQIMFVCKDSTGLYSTPSFDQKPILYIHWADSLQIIKKSKIPSINPSKEVANRKDLFSNWTQVRTTFGIEGWLPFNEMQKKLLPPPLKILNVNEGDIYQDELYPIGWSKNGFACIIEGYIDGAVDGLTVRYQVHHFDTIKKESIEDYTSYQDPVETMWKQRGFDIQHSLNRNKIIPLTQAIELNRSIILVNNKDTLHMFWDFSKSPIEVIASAGGITKTIHIIQEPIQRILVLGWLSNPLNPQQIVVVLAYIMDSSGHYIEVVPIDLKQFGKKK